MYQKKLLSVSHKSFTNLFIFADNAVALFRVCVREPIGVRYAKISEELERWVESKEFFSFVEKVTMS
jgi:hypothetical protein